MLLVMRNGISMSLDFDSLLAESCQIERLYSCCNAGQVSHTRLPPCFADCSNSNEVSTVLSWVNSVYNLIENVVRNLIPPRHKRSMRSLLPSFTHLLFLCSSSPGLGIPDAFAQMYFGIVCVHTRQIRCSSYRKIWSSAASVWVGKSIKQCGGSRKGIEIKHVREISFKGSGSCLLTLRCFSKSQSMNDVGAVQMLSVSSKQLS